MHLCEFDKPEEEVMGIKNVFFRIGTTLNSKRVPSMPNSLRKPARYTESYVKTKAKVDELMLSEQLLPTLNVKTVEPITRQGPA